ncbi:hypothetical protein [Acinetobacter sp. ANC 3903]|uniref:hypothetical protein n=1 Tax=Acinetobacter sp. ANC 3903 TaxID=1977883 RepID=UPI001D17720B|nr:hypothetical protein [Acinetobacter sp. ANC 3903]
MSVLYCWLDLSNKIKTAKSKVKELFTKLDDDTYEYFFTLTESEIKELVTDDKWLADLAKQINADVERVAQRLTVRVRELAERYEFTLGQLTQSVEELEKQVEAHLVAMGFEL